MKQPLEEFSISEWKQNSRVNNRKAKGALERASQVLGMWRRAFA